MTGEVDDYRRQQSWTTDTELLATVVDMLAAISAQLGAGIPVGMVKQLRKPKRAKPVTRPDWIKKNRKPDQLVMGPGDFIRMLAANKQI